jgi:hypothetical protein
MSYSSTATETTTFTITHARHLAAKVATDLKRLQRFYGYPSDASIGSFEAEIIALLKSGYLGTVTYGFQRDGRWIEPTLRYTSRDLHTEGSDDDPGRIRPGADVSGASFCSYLTYSAIWGLLSSAEQGQFERTLAVQRTGAPEPGVAGYLVDDRTYSAGGRALTRAAVRSL